MAFTVIYALIKFPLHQTMPMQFLNYYFPSMKNRKKEDANKCGGDRVHGQLIRSSLEPLSWPCWPGSDHLTEQSEWEARAAELKI